MKSKQHKPSAPLNEAWSISSLSIATAIDRRTLRRLLRDVKPAEHDGQGHARYKLADLISALRHDQRGSSELSQRASVAATRRAEIDSDLAQLELDKQMGVVVLASAVEIEWCEHVTMAKQRFQALPGKLRSSAGLSDSQFAKLEREIHDALKELSRTDAPKEETHEH
jgi:hypothetical protein